MTFAIIFSIIDVLNVLFAIFQRKHFTKPLVESYFQVIYWENLDNSPQIYLIIGFSLLLGCIYGLLFGFMDLEDNFFEKGALKKQEFLCFPIGVLLGGLAGGLNEYFRQTVIKLLRIYWVLLGFIESLNNRALITAKSRRWTATTARFREKSRKTKKIATKVEKTESFDYNSFKFQGKNHKIYNFL